VLRALTRYQWLVLFAAWLGWGFDVFDAMLFNFVAPSCVPALLGLTPGSAEARQATVFWTGILSALLLVGWAAGGAAFGWLADRHGRRRALMITILVYAVGTTLCAFATSIGQLVAFRALTSLGIGGEWAVGAALVAETVPEAHRVEAGTLLQTASPLGIVLASVVSYQFTGVWFADQPGIAWRYVFLCGLAPVTLAVLVRLFVRESETWLRTAARAPPPAIPALFAAPMRRATLSALLVSITGLLTWWGVNAFVPLLGSLLAAEQARAALLPPAESALLAEAWKTQASNAFNLGGLVGTFAAIPLAQRLGRRAMFVAYFTFSALLLFATFGLPLQPEARLAMLFPVGLGVYGVFSAYVFYLPELFPTRLRALGSGFCYNIGRVLAAAGPSVFGLVAANAGGSPAVIMQAMFWIGVVPLAVALTARWTIVETRGRTLPA
jgi:MFS family permease